MGDTTATITYFEKAGPENTTSTLLLAKARADALGVRHVVVPSTSGATGLEATRALPGLEVVVMSHSTGFSGPNKQEMPAQVRLDIESRGAQVYTCQHALGGIGRAVRRKLGTYQVDEIIAYSLRTLGQGFKVACELTLMAADVGAVPVGEEIIALGGTGRGIDTALVIQAVNAQDFFELRVLEVLCKPRSW